MPKLEKIILASKSPRRRDLLKIITENFSVLTADVNEKLICDQILANKNEYPDFDRTAAAMVQELSRAKVTALAETLPDPTEHLLLGADTIVVLDDEIMGKPRDRAEARRMLYRLSGREHQVFTGVYILAGKKSSLFYSEAKVSFHPLDDFSKNCIEHYIASGSPMDKAGAYGIQDEGSFLVKSVNGDFFTVMGLPLAETARRLYSLMPELLF